MESNKALERTISAIRFPLLFGVVLIHTSVRCNVADAPVYSFFHKLISELMVAPCVPAFFFISGFLFFYNVVSYDKKVYLNKLKRRFWTLLIPYLFWNLLVIGYYLVGHLCLPSVISDDNYNIADYSFTEILGLFWDYPRGFPICYQFWYLRDLIVICVLSPIVYLLIKYLSKYVILLLLTLFVCFDKYGMLGSCLLFAMGSYFSIWRIDLIAIVKRFRCFLFPLFVLSLLLVLFVKDIGWTHRIMIIFGIGSFLSFAAMYVDRFDFKSTLFDKSTFFIYGFHGFPIVLLSTTILPRIFWQSDAMCLLQYALTPVIIITISVSLYVLLNKLCPRFLAVITGGRK